MSEDAPHGHVPAPAPPPSPRAFCQATGFIYQIVGFTLAISTCCWWSFTGLAQDEIRPTKGEAMVRLSRDMKPEQMWSLAATCISLVGGLALTAIGIGLQHDRIARPVWVLAPTAAGAAFYAAYTIAAWITFPDRGRIIVGGALGVIWLIMFLLGGTSAEQLRKHPPVTEPETMTSRDVDDLRRSASPRRQDRTSL